jgi:hypothetical protein
MAMNKSCQAGLVVEFDSANASIGSISLGLVTAPTTGAVVLGKEHNRPLGCGRIG